MNGRGGDTSAAFDLSVTRGKLLSDQNWVILDGMNAAARARTAATPLIPLLLEFLTSDAYVPCTQREYEFSGHALLAFEAMRAVESIGVAPDQERLRHLLLLPESKLFPEASYDQGAYIGDYSSESLAPAGLAAKLVPMLGQRSFDLLPELYQAAISIEDETIGQPARRTITILAKKLLPDASAEARSAFSAMAQHMADHPDAIEPKSHRGFDLRDLAILCKKQLAALA